MWIGFFYAVIQVREDFQMLEDWDRCLKNPHEARNLEQTYTLQAGWDWPFLPNAGAGLVLGLGFFFFFPFFLYSVTLNLSALFWSLKTMEATNGRGNFWALWILLIAAVSLCLKPDITSKWWDLHTPTWRGLFIIIIIINNVIISYKNMMWRIWKNRLFLFFGGGVKLWTAEWLQTVPGKKLLVSSSCISVKSCCSDLKYLIYASILSNLIRSKLLI